MELGSYAVALVALAVLGWLAFLIATSLRGRGRLEVPPNLAPFQTDEELESKRLERWQVSAVVFSGILALSLPIYFVSEQNRQEGFVEEFSVGEFPLGRDAPFPFVFQLPTELQGRDFVNVRIASDDWIFSSIQNQGPRRLERSSSIRRTWTLN